MYAALCQLVRYSTDVLDRGVWMRSLQHQDLSVLDNSLAGRARIQRSVDKATFDGIKIQYRFLDRRPPWFWLMKLLSDDRNVPTTNEGSFQVRHGGRCFDPIGIWSPANPFCCRVSGYHVTFHACAGDGRTANLSTVEYRLDKIMMSRFLLVDRSEPTSDIYHFITSELNRRTFGDLREHRGYTI